MLLCVAKLKVIENVLEFHNTTDTKNIGLGANEMLSDSRSLKGDTWIICNKGISLMFFCELTSVLFRS